MSNTIAEAEELGEGSIPFDVSKLVDVNKDEQSYENCWEASIEELSDQNKVLDKIKGFRHIHYTTKDFSTIA